MRPTPEQQRSLDSRYYDTGYEEMGIGFAHGQPDHDIICTRCGRTLADDMTSEQRNGPACPECGAGHEEESPAGQEGGHRMNLTTTFNLLHKAGACTARYRFLRESLKNVKDDEPINLLTILETNGFDDALWALQATAENCDKVARLMAADFAEQVLPIWQKYSDDKRPKLAIKAARDFAHGKITREELDAAEAAADAAAGAAGAAADAAARAKQREIFIGYLQPEAGTE